MKCPVCKDVTLLMSEKRGVEIDYCPECRGIWLDRGELEKLISNEENYNQSHYTKKEYEKDDNRDNYYNDKNGKYHKRKKESFLGEIFDIFGD